jgi:hypothetical protein
MDIHKLVRDLAVNIVAVIFCTGFALNKLPQWIADDHLRAVWMISGSALLVYLSVTVGIDLLHKQIKPARAWVETATVNGDQLGHPTSVTIVVHGINTGSDPTTSRFIIKLEPLVSYLHPLVLNASNADLSVLDVARLSKSEVAFKLRAWPQQDEAKVRLQALATALRGGKAVHAFVDWHRTAVAQRHLGLRNNGFTYEASE